MFSGVIKKVQKAVSPAAKGMGGLLNEMTGVYGQMDKSYAQQKAMMDLQNQYNSPAAQLARMAEAGIEINPTSYALGTGNLSNTSASGFAGSGSPAGNPITMAMGVANGIQGIKESKARTALDEANISNMDATRLNTEERTRQMKNDNTFFEKYGYYPAHAEQPVLSGYVNGPVGTGVKNTVAQITSDIKNPTLMTVVRHPLLGAMSYGVSALRDAWKKFRK